MTNLIGLSQEELQKIAEDLGEPKFRADQIYKWIYGHRVDEIDEMNNVSKKFRQKLKLEYKLDHIKVLKVLKDNNDDTHKFLLSLDDDNIIECVLMKYTYGFTLCISTQIGCKMGCKFCASTIDGIVRNLSSGEMIDQILVIENYLNIRVSNIVLMGSGEPLDNYDEVLKFVYNVNNPNGVGLGKRHITLSTCGIVPKIYELADENLQINLSCSLHAPNNSIRNKMMPINKKYPIEELIEACKYYVNKTGRRVTFEYAMISGTNDSLDCAKELEFKLRDIICLINLIPINEIKESSFIKSEKDNIIKFSKYLNTVGIQTTIRRELGSSINAACGQLRRDILNNPER
ncbi:23S rRNA (adenine(2503)-C(2))-methyltransferase RlmN [Alkalibaculum sp. M08DMB]|uniref:Probable dual-specificity RNA methyltransferase RlmN n=1 Tax=Alkalibaculum sporogenes TaxID=2655001 RepID=A0A6A7K9D2_9FIRM|nr:23S rRNA (adenine(2503)-C(2))-methyltransferase RlmN [Alkalibaculum sporogenes]MPW26034.1 23S rRNA (adenine(2503)-C(2))-methyltransferase RlmN [Alkalibaculum sporogenes]